MGSGFTEWSCAVVITTSPLVCKSEDKTQKRYLTKYEKTGATFSGIELLALFKKPGEDTELRKLVQKMCYIQPELFLYLN